MAAKMEHDAQSSEARFSKYVDTLSSALGRDDRVQPLKDYCIGLLMPGERKSVEPIAAVVAPSRVSAKHQSLLDLVGQAAWSDEAVLSKVRGLVLPAIEAQGGPIEAWIVDDTGFAKKGVHSVGVARQYRGWLGKTDNCQIAMTLSIANHAASLPIGFCRKFCVRARCRTAGLSRLTPRERRPASLDTICPPFGTAPFGSCA
jgi:SRSO17 transposase